MTTDGASGTGSPTLDLVVGEELSIPWLEGRRFVVARVLAGGMGSVYQLVPTDSRLRSVALKTIQATADPAKFRRECEMWLVLSGHRNVAAAIAYGELREIPCIVAEWCASTLAEMPLVAQDTDRLMRTVEGIVAALIHMDSAFGVVHQDIKPQNILLDDGGSPRLADFGLARVLRQKVTPGVGPINLSKHTIAEMGVAGTPFFMAPELLVGRGQPGRATDMFSLGVTLYCSLCGQHPYVVDGGWKADSTLQRPELARVLVRHGSFGARLLKEIETLLAIDPSRRPTSYESVARNLFGSPMSAGRDLDGDEAAIVAVASLHRKHGRYDEARGVLLKAIRGDASPVLVNALGCVAVAQKNGEEAIRLFKRAVAMMDSETGTHRGAVYADPAVNLGWQMICARDFSGARRALGLAEGWLQSDPSMEAVAQYPEFGWMKLYDGLCDQAMRYLLRVSQHARLADTAVTWTALAASLCGGGPMAAKWLFGRLSDYRPLSMELAISTVILSWSLTGRDSVALSAAAWVDQETGLERLASDMKLVRGAFRLPTTPAMKRALVGALDFATTGGRNRELVRAVFESALDSR